MTSEQGDLFGGEAYRPVPVSTARYVAEACAKEWVVIIAFDAVHGLIHGTSYGVSPASKDEAARIADEMVRLLTPSPVRIPFEDFRATDQAKRAAAIQNLSGATKQVLEILRAADRSVELSGECIDAVDRSIEILEQATMEAADG